MDTELPEQERISLRQELHNLKACQITFLTTSVTGTGLLLGLATTLAAKTELGSITRGIIFLLPLIVLLPFWWVFFDKATSITRIVGYYRILEKLILKRSKANFIGWENAIGKFRTMQADKKFKPFPRKDMRPWHRRLGSILGLRTGHKYWVISYYIFFSLSSVCTITSSRLFGQWFLVSPLVLLFAFSAWWNIRIVWQLIYGQHSYDANEDYWKQVLEVEPSSPTQTSELNHPPCSAA